MDIVKLPLGSSASMDISISAGNVVLTITVSAKPEVDALLAALSSKLPAAIQPLIAVAQSAIDTELSAP
jgi:hypothetical protein